MSTRESLLEDAQSKDITPFDYIVVGSGAGGGPLACRLALAGKRVLLVEAGDDPVKAQPSPACPGASIGEVTRVPGYHATSTEDGEMSWMFSVRHYADTGRQEKDAKYNQTPFDPNRSPGASDALDPKYLDPHPLGGKQGIFYPRSSGLGGCTSHHAMILIAPNDKDWNYIADLTGDDSWVAEKMRPYFAKIERCLYIGAYNQFLRRTLGLIYKIWRWLILLFHPGNFVEKGGHGVNGWQPTSFIDPYLVTTIAKNDRSFFKAIVRAALAVLHGNSSLVALLKHSIFRLRIVEQIDFNDINTRRSSPEGIFLIPVGIESQTPVEDDGQVFVGCRQGVREFVLKTAKEVPDRLVITTALHVTRVVFEKTAPGEPPRAIGVEGVVGDHLYEASPLQKLAPANAEVRIFARGEVVLCGGAFNTPQLLMLSGIGDRSHLADHGIQYLRGADGEPLSKGRLDKNADVLPHAPVIHLPGVGRNLQDRYEITVVSELNKQLTTLKGLTFRPGDSNDPGRVAWLEGKKGLYATNGGVLAILRRSSALRDDEREPDLFTFAAPATFRGYYWNWSRELFRHALGGQEPDQHNFWSWVILKAYTRNNGGTVRLRSARPLDMPEICFHSFEETPGDGWKKDVAALVDAVRYMRRVNARNPEQFVREIQPGAEIADGSADLEDWIKTQAWGHHACGTCRIGADPWQPDPKSLKDTGAVLDSYFRVHGVRGLRVVDASVFPKIPGYFIATSIFMISEKAAVTMLQDSTEDVYRQQVWAHGASDHPDVLQAAEDEPEEEFSAAAGPYSTVVDAPRSPEAPDDSPTVDAPVSAEVPAYPVGPNAPESSELSYAPIADTGVSEERPAVGAERPDRKDQKMRGYRILTLPWMFPWKSRSSSQAGTHAEPKHSEDTPRRVVPLSGSSAASTEGTGMLTNEETSLSGHLNRAHVEFQGSTEFYDTPSTDPYTPSYLEAKPLVSNVGTPWDDGRLPPWIEKGNPKPPWVQYVEWFNGIWHSGDPSDWSEEIFTNTVITSDPSGITRGAEQAAANFQLLFRFFPDLRGEVVSWAANERELFINWRFRIPNTKNRQPIGPITEFLYEHQHGRDYLVPVLDKFCFVEGHVSYRLAYFDIGTLIGFLSETYGGNQLYDFLIATVWQAQFSGGILLFFRGVVNMLLGLFVWAPQPKPSTVFASPGNGVVLLKWLPVKKAIEYEVTRSFFIEGPYSSPSPDGRRVLIAEKGSELFHSYEDRDVVNGTPYWYLVRPIFAKAKHTPVCKLVSKKQPEPVENFEKVRRRAREHRAV
jgi:choline dehydrogenase-like flavoprotein